MTLNYALQRARSGSNRHSVSIAPQPVPTSPLPLTSSIPETLTHFHKIARAVRRWETDTVVRWQRERFRRFWARLSKPQRRGRGAPAPP
jgi:hypothetical protein